MEPMTNEHFAAWCEQMIGQPYWYGTTIAKCSESLMESKTRQYPDHYKGDRTARYKADIAAKKVCADCVGACKGYAWTNGGEGVLESIGTSDSIPRKYGSNGCPDRSANGMFEYAKSQGMDWGTIDTMPEIRGLAVRFDGHVGYYVGGGEVVEWRGFKYGCVRTALKGRGWTHWYKLPFIDYGAEVGLPATDTILGNRLLKRGSAGADVKALQEALVKLGCDVGAAGIDGEFGPDTEKAVKLFQARVGLAQDGQYGEKTHAALMAALTDSDAPGEQAEEEAEEQSVRKLTVTGGSVYVRSGPGVQYATLTVVRRGDELHTLDTAVNGWHAVELGGRVGWISPKYTREIAE